MDRYGFDGLDLYPEFQKFPTVETILAEENREAYTAIVTSLRQAFSQTYLLTSAMPAQDEFIRPHYEVAKVAQQVDWLNLMTHDYYLFDSYEPLTAPIAPLHSIVSDKNSPLSNFSVEWSVNEYIRLGAPKEKIVMGIHTYARGYRIPIMSSWSEPRAFMVATEAIGGQGKNYYNFKEVCKLWRKPRTSWYHDPDAQETYMIPSPSTWITFQEKRSIEKRAEFLMKTGLAGYVSWNLNSDNFDGPCYHNDDSRNVLHTHLLHTIELIMGIPNGFDYNP